MRSNRNQNSRCGRLRLLALFGLVAAGLLVFPQSAAAMGSPRTAAIQVGLKARGLYAGTIDGLWGPGTARGVRRLQWRSGLAVDGVVGPRTRLALGRLGRPLLGRRAMRQGLVGWDVSQLQFMLAWHGFPSGTMDGAFGARTDRALRRFQWFARLGVDGVAGPATLRALRSPLPTSPLPVSSPIPAPVGDRFGPRGSRFHTGLDYTAGYGAAVRAARSGRVRIAGWDNGGYGYFVVVRHGAGVYTWYAHLSRIAVSRGQHVSRGSRLGAVGATGHAFGPHLHFEVRYRGAATNPLTALR
ncbi:MAG: peptidoglycan DD-metalloendopeptidase family protein [Actinobacteria bacterium]|nr:peptidoglycan DD-metalloendopeptidase family protein [Actinomycetota bacterium]